MFYRWAGRAHFPRKGYEFNGQEQYLTCIHVALEHRGSRGPGLPDPTRNMYIAFIALQTLYLVVVIKRVRPGQSLLDKCLPLPPTCLLRCTRKA